jgi:D-aminopeptidase
LRDAKEGRGLRARELGIGIGRGAPGPDNAITDVGGVSVGHATLVAGEGPRRTGRGPVRTGVTVVLPREGLARDAPLFAGCHRLNGNGDMTGLEWIRESGTLTTPIAITNTHSVGVVRDALIAAELEARSDDGLYWCMPVVGETFDGVLNDINGMHVTVADVRAALAAARPGPVDEGSVGGGTGMICHEFKGGIGTSSRVLAAQDGGWTVGALVQANHGRRALLRVDGAPVGRVLDTDRVPSPFDMLAAKRAGRTSAAGAGSIIVVLATNAPLLPHQCERLAQRAGLGVARAGGGLEDSSGDLFIAFATGNDDIPRVDYGSDAGGPFAVRMLPNQAMTPLFEAAAEATEEAIVNALLAAGTVTGADDITAHGLTGELLTEALAELRSEAPR